jgi:hypothetical protein
MTTTGPAILFVAAAMGFGWALYYDFRRGKVAVAGGFFKPTYAERRVDPLFFWGALTLKSVVLSTILFFLGSNMLRSEAMRPLTPSGFHRFTGVELCTGDQLSDRSSDAERNTVPGFAFHVEVQLDRSCPSKFEDKLAMLAPRECATDKVKSGGCYVKDAWPHATEHTTVIVKPLTADRYEVRFWE